MIITGFQLRAAKATLKLTLTNLAENTHTGISKITLSRLVNKINNYQKISCSAIDAEKLFVFFSAQGVIFEENNIIRVNEKIDSKPTDSDLTRFQLVSSRAAMHMSLRALEKHVNIGYRALAYLENKNNNYYIKNRGVDIKDVIQFFNTNGITFPDNTSVQLTKKEKTH